MQAWLLTASAGVAKRGSAQKKLRIFLIPSLKLAMLKAKLFKGLAFK